jgi:hypothetical protein
MTSIFTINEKIGDEFYAAESIIVADAIAT